MLRSGARGAAKRPIANVPAPGCKAEKAVVRVKLGAGRCVTAICRVCPQSGQRAASRGVSDESRESLRRFRSTTHICLPFCWQQAGRFPRGCPAPSSGRAAPASTTSTARMAMGRFIRSSSKSSLDYFRPSVPSMDMTPGRNRLETGGRDRRAEGTFSHDLPGNKVNIPSVPEVP